MMLLRSVGEDKTVEFDVVESEKGMEVMNAMGPGGAAGQDSD